MPASEILSKILVSIARVVVTRMNTRTAVVSNGVFGMA